MPPPPDAKPEWFKVMCQASPDFMVVVDRQRRFYWVNRLYPGLTMDDVIGKPLEDFEHPDTRERSRGAIERAFETGRPTGFESHAVLPDGSENWYQVRCIPIEGYPDQMMLVTTDITERTLAERERDLYQQQLYQSRKMEAIGRLAGGVAHDFNNLLTPIIGHVDIAAAELPGDHPVQESLRGVREAATRAARLTQQLLTIGRELPSRADFVDLAAIVRNMSRMLERVVPENIRMATDEVRPGAWVWADAGQVEQILLNLVLNGCDAMPRGGTLEIRTHVADGEVTLSVRDTGEGMSDETARRIFEPFFTTKPKGTGLGLAMANGIVEQSGGRIDVTSRPGVGTTFAVVLPLREPEHRATSAAPASATPGPFAGTALVIDDSEEVRSVVARQLRSAGFEVLEAASGEDALSHATQLAPGALDLVLSDVLMRGMDGIEAVRRLRLRHPNAAAVLMSGHPADVLQGARLAATSLLHKPFDTTQLLSKVRDALDARSEKASP